MRDLLMHLVSQIDCTIGTACNGREAIERIGDFSPEVMILDINMPELDGFRVLAWLADQGLTEQVRTIVLTARGQREDVAKAFELGAKDYLLKPFESRHLFLRMARLLVRSRSELQARVTRRFNGDARSIDQTAIPRPA